MTFRVIQTVQAEEAYEAASRAVADGEVIVLPTDTVYGVGADAMNEAAVARLLQAKERGRDFPPPVLVAEVGMVRALSARVDDRLTRLAEAFWPGPLTVVLRARDSLRMDLGDRGDTIAVRVPDHDFTRELLRRTGPLAVSSANVHGADAALTIEDASGQLADRVSLYLDGGTMAGNEPSTIVDLTEDRAQVLREGRISIDRLNEAVPGLVDVPEPEVDAAAPRHATTEGSAREEGSTPRRAEPAASARDEP